MNWRLDTNGSGTADVIGTFRFHDPQGEPTLPLTPEELEIVQGNSDLAWLRGLLDTLPAESQLVLSFTQQGAADVTGFLGVTLIDGPSALTGTVNVIAVRCNTAFRLRSVTAMDLLGVPLAEVGEPA